MTTQVAQKIITFDNILYATDFSRQSNIALPFALSIAHKYGSRLLALHVLTPPPLDNIKTIEVQALGAQALREAHDSMTELERRLGAVPHEAILRKGDIWDELSSIQLDKNVGLIVLGTHGRAGVSKLLMGSVAEKIFRQSICPVLTVGPNVSADPGVSLIFTRFCAQWILPTLLWPRSPTRSHLHRKTRRASIF
jgi:nucleotide-binding universal stress UspA family protein